MKRNENSIKKYKGKYDLKIGIENPKYTKKFAIVESIVATKIYKISLILANLHMLLYSLQMYIKTTVKTML